MTLLTYQLNWSELSMPISNKLLFFLILNLLLFLVLGRLFNSRKKKAIKKEYGYKKSYFFMSLFIIMGILLEGIVLKGYPLLNSFGLGTIQYIDYGIPLFHVLLMTVSYFFSVVLFENIIHELNKKQLYISLVVSWIPFILTINRGMLVMMIISYISLYFQYKNFSLNRKTITIAISGFFLFLYLFGLFGNYRINSDYKQQRSITDSAIIMDVGGATESFKKSFIPKEFFWSYTYITSPLSNLQHNISEHANKGISEKDNFIDFVKVIFLPETLSKRMKTTEVTSYQVRSELTVGTAYYEVFPRYGWLGMYIYLAVISVFPFLYLTLLNRFAKEYTKIGVSLLCTIYSLLFFTNFLSYTGLMFQLTFPFVLSFEKKYNIGSRFLKLVRK